MNYLSRDSLAAHVDYPPLITNERGAAKYKIPLGNVPCPKCCGHGGWNLRLNAYPLPPGFPNTPGNRHRHTHFRSSCDQCNGWGHVPEADAKCIHEFKHHRNVGNCLNEYKCEKCGIIRTVDSSG